MMIINKVKEIIRNPFRILIALDSRGVFHLRDETYLKLLYKIKLGTKLNLDKPETFNEKMQWLKLHNRKDIYTTMVDKCEVKKYIDKTIGKEYVVPTLGVYDKFDDISFDELPRRFVIKCTHDSGGLVICRDKRKIDIDDARRKINKYLKRNFYYQGREWPYKNVKPRIIIEEYLEDSNSADLKDYKFFVFNGEVKCFKVDFNRFVKHQANYYDRNARLLKFGEEMCPPDFSKKITMPKNLKKMIKLAEILSDNSPFMRVDFYDIDGKIYFGEITFYPASGFGRFVPEEWDKTLGDWIVL